MSAEDLGRRLRNEVVEESLNETLQALWSLHANSRPATTIKPIDDLLRIFQLSGLIQEHDRDHSKESFRQSKLPIIELCSAGSSQGKTQLLYLLTAAAVLPATYGNAEIKIEGRNGAVIVFDTDGRFNILRLAQVMQFYISIHRRSMTSKNDDEAIHVSGQIVAGDDDTDLIRSCLRHVHVFKPQSFSSLIDTLEGLETYIFNFDEHFSASKAISAVLLDSPGAFHWQQKRQIEDAKLQGISSANSLQIDASIAANVYSRLKKQLTTIAKSLACPVVFTTRSTDNRAANTRSHEPSITPEHAGTWSGFATLRLLVSKVAVDRFPPAYSVDEALRDRLARQEVVERGRYEIHLNYWGAENWNEDLRSAVRGAITRIPLWIGVDGVWVKDPKGS
ncbi:MAG: hypothetical protein M1820_002526 [Bogoriella megaspora]|nr:MAG: hypothetical protein M1820_002526 [Bogoriella megaspora]